VFGAGDSRALADERRVMAVKRIVVLVIAVLALGTSVAAAWTKKETGIVGYGYYSGGPAALIRHHIVVPVVDLTVEATQAGHMVAVVHTRRRGRFLLEVKPGVYELRIEIPGRSRCGYLNNVVVRSDEFTHARIYCNVP
jgi:hypothetical protein